MAIRWTDEMIMAKTREAAKHFKQTKGIEFDSENKEHCFALCRILDEWEIPLPDEIKRLGSKGKK